MPRLRCPRCASVVEVAPGATPACTSCGFGGPAIAPTAPPAVPEPAPAAASAPAVAPAPAPSRRGAVIAICVVGFLVLAGAAAAVAYFAMRGEEPGALTEAEARTRVQASLQAAGDALTGSSDDGDLRKVTIETESSGTPSGPEDFFGGMGDMTATIEYGRSDRVRFDLHMASGAVTVAFTMICTPERQYMIAGGETYASRPTVVPSDEGDSMCQGLDEGGLNETMPPLDELASEEAALTRNDDGSVRAVVDDPEEGHYVVDIDAKGRVRTITAEPPAGEDLDMTMTMTFEYGDRSSIGTPADFKLLPASVDFERDWEGADQTWTVRESREEPPLADFEVRVQDYSFDFDDGGDADVARAVFELDDGRTQAGDNLTFEFTDADQDGKLSAGDSFVVRDLAAQADTLDEAPPEDPCVDDPEFCDEYDYGFDYGYSSYEVVVYDRVADGEVNSGFSSMPSPVWLALAGLGLAGLAARRRR